MKKFHKTYLIGLFLIFFLVVGISYLTTFKILQKRHIEKRKEVMVTKEVLKYPNIETLEKTGAKDFDYANPNSTTTEHATSKHLVAPGFPSATSSLKSVRVPILIYHSVRPARKETKEQDMFDITPELFEKELQYIRDNGFTTIRMDDLTEAIKGNKELPKKPIAINFDDGWKNQYQYAYPLLQKYGMIATFYIYTNPIAHNKPHFISWEMVKEMDKAGHEIGNHSWTHPYLTKITDPKLLDKEVIWSKEVIEEKLGHPIKSIAYPFGYYNARVIAETEKAGFTNGRGVFSGVWNDEAHVYEIRGKITDDYFENFVKYVEEE